MKLSELNATPLYPVVIPSTQKTVKYRPFLVKEEWALLSAQESENLGVMLATLKNVVSACIEPSSAVDNMTSFDLEYLFTLIRAKSVGEYSTLTFRCDTCDDPNATAVVNLDLRTVELSNPMKKDNKVKLSDSITVLMKFPSMDELIAIQDSNDVEKAKMQAVKACMVSIFVENEVYNVKEEPEEELNGFMETLTSKQFKLLEEFFDSMPEAQIKTSYKCPVCGTEHNKVIKGLNNFF